MKNKITFLIVLIFSFVNLPAQALYGTRPMGMGGAFTAIADDANAAYWNPAGFALNPGVDIYGSLLLNNRNQKIGDNLAALKMCYETEVNPFVWIIGVGAVSLLALSGAKYLHEKGVLQKGWGRDVEKVGKEEPVSEKVLEQGEEKIYPVGQKVKEKVTEIAKEMLGTTTRSISQVSVRPVYWGPLYNPWVYHHPRNPSYWDNREEYPDHSPQGKAQFAAGVTWVTDKNDLLNQDTNWYSFSLASGYAERVALGGNVNFYDIGLTTPAGNTMKGYGAGIDLGLLIRPVEKLSIGAMAKEILTTDIIFENKTTISYKMSINLGAAVRPVEILTLSADIHNFFRQSGDPQTYHYGLELRPFPGLAFRGGLYDGNKTAGASLMIWDVIIDYAYLGGEFNRTQMAGLTWKF